MFRTLRTRPALLIAVAAIGLGAAACGSDDDGQAAAGTGGHPSSTARDASSQAAAESIAPGPPAEGDHNDADADFASGMIPHHGQAIQMADLVLPKTSNAEVKALAERIKAAQAPEIATMSGWLKGWQVAVPDPFAAPMGGMHGDHLMSAEDMAGMRSAGSSQVDRMFLTMMPEHHRGAIQMARGELSAGTNPTAKALAQKIIDDQTAEIEEMNAMLRDLD
jgi:uncharacterized protein (DUF305 family)